MKSKKQHFPSGRIYDKFDWVQERWQVINYSYDDPFQ